MVLIFRAFHVKRCIDAARFYAQPAHLSIAYKARRREMSLSSHNISLWRVH